MSCCSPEGTCSTTAEAASSQTESVTTAYEVKGMTCGHCKSTVTGAVSALDGVSGVEVDVAAGRVTVSSAGPLDDAAVRDAINEAGYELVGRSA